MLIPFRHAGQPDTTTPSRAQPRRRLIHEMAEVVAADFLLNGVEQF